MHDDFNTCVVHLDLIASSLRDDLHKQHYHPGGYGAVLIRGKQLLIGKN